MCLIVLPLKEDGMGVGRREVRKRSIGMSKRRRQTGCGSGREGMRGRKGRGERPGAPRG